MRQLRCHGNYRQQRGTQEEGRPWPQTHYGSVGGGRLAAKATTGVGRHQGPGWAGCFGEVVRME